MMVRQGGGYLGYFWCPLEKETEVNNCIAEFTASKITRIQDNFGITPPTYIKTSDFTWCFQQIVDTYGIPSYQEANPTPISIVTFPFCFGVMFGDMGHGSILAFFGLFLVLGNDKLKGSFFKDFLPVRYFLFLLGLCSFYSGLMYNEFFAMPTNIFESCYKLD